MDIETSLAERVIHLALFCAAGIGAGLAGFAAIERLSAGTRMVRAVHVIAAGGLIAMLALAERAWHAMH